MELDGPGLRFGTTMPLGEAETAWQARWLESLGFDYVAVGEHFMRATPIAQLRRTPAPGSRGRRNGAYTLLSSVLLAPFYHPTVLLQARVDSRHSLRRPPDAGSRSGRRVPGRVRRSRTQRQAAGRRANECLEALRRLWTEEHVTFTGSHFQLDDVTMNPRPVRSPTRRSGWRADATPR